MTDDEALAVWNDLSAGARETLRCLIYKGPTWDGDVPSKAGRDELLRKGLASKAVVKREQGYQVANYRGWTVYKAGKPEEFELPYIIAKRAIATASKPADGATDA